MIFYYIFIVVLLIVYVLQWHAVRAACRKENDMRWKYRIMANKLRLSERSRKRLATGIVGNESKRCNCAKRK